MLKSGDMEKADKRKNGKKAVRNIVFLAAILLIAYYVLRDSWGNIWAELRRTSGKIIAGAFLCSILYNCFDGIAVTRLLRCCDDRFSWYQGILCSFYYSFFRVVTFGSGTAAAGMFYVNRLGIPVSRSLGIFTINYIIQRITVCLYFVVSFLIHFSFMSGLYQDYTIYMLLGVLIAVIVAAVLILICVCEPLHRFGFSLAKKYIRKDNLLVKIGEIEEKAVTLRNEAWILLHDKKLLAEVVFLNLCKLTAWYLIPVLLFEKLNFSQHGLLVAVTAMVTALAGVIPTPGGIGAVEFVFVLMFTPLVGKVEATSGTLIYRFATYILPFLIGAVVQIHVMVHDRKGTGTQ